MPASADSIATKRVSELHPYHLPGNNARQDWMQYMRNNHPLLGLCCHHRLHPMKWRPRLIILLGSFAYGVAITNAIYLYFLGSGRDDEQQVFALDMSLQETTTHIFSMTSGLLALLTIGSGSHAVFDRFVWTMSACGCCRAGGRCETRACCKDLGTYLVIFLVTLIVALASFIVVIRASMEEDDTSIPVLQNFTKAEIARVMDFEQYKVEDYSFLKGYIVEFLVSLFLWYPFFETILSSLGYLGASAFQCLVGGRQR
ncbi:hypothetical protein ACHAXT_001903 [Thalassiosira profunda]